MGPCECEKSELSERGAPSFSGVRDALHQFAQAHAPDRRHAVSSLETPQMAAKPPRI